MLLSVQGIFSAIKRVSLTQALQRVQNIKIMSRLVLSTDGRVLLCWFQRTKSIRVDTAWAKNRFLSELAIYPRVNFELIRIELWVVVLCINVKWLLQALVRLIVSREDALKLLFLHLLLQLERLENSLILRRPKIIELWGLIWTRARRARHLE